MVDDFQDIEDVAISLPISAKNREIAYRFAARQATKQKAEQVLHNTLAVLTVQSYLKMLGIATDLRESDSWNPIMQTCDDVADLNILDLGKLECRPVRNSDTSCHIPMEVWDLRIGYVMVKIDRSLKQGALLGFVPEVVTEELAIADLKPVEALIDRLDHLKKSTVNSSLVNLEQWLNKIYTTGWLTVESLLNSEQLVPALKFRNARLSVENALELEKINNSIQRAKLIDLGIQFGDRQIVLLVEITPEDSGNIAVTLQVHPSQNSIYLPETLILQVIESSGEVFMQAQARSKDNFIQLQFSGQPQEYFTVRIILDDAKLTEQFQL